MIKIFNPRELVSESLGTGLLLATVVGSGIMGERLAGGNVAIALLANTLATGAALVALILTFGPVSGAHFNPAVTLGDAWSGGLPWRKVPGYLAAQFAGALLGVAAANLMFDLPAFHASQHARHGASQLFSEFTATFGPVSGAHFNPVVTLGDAWSGSLPWRKVPGYLAAQCAGALLGVAAANLMFDLPAFHASQHARHGASQLFSEFTATFGLLAVIWGCTRRRPGATPFAVAAYITAAYWFTASTSFANPAVTLARSASDTFAGIRLADVPGFVLVQLAGAFAATALFKWLVPVLPPAAQEAGRQGSPAAVDIVTSQSSPRNGNHA